MMKANVAAICLFGPALFINSVVSQKLLTIPLKKSPAEKVAGASLGRPYADVMVGTPAQNVRLMVDISTGIVVR